MGESVMNLLHGTYRDGLAQLYREFVERYFDVLDAGVHVSYSGLKAAQSMRFKFALLAALASSLPHILKMHAAPEGAVCSGIV
jgi:hypothetical protein